MNETYEQRRLAYLKRKADAGRIIVGVVVIVVIAVIAASGYGLALIVRGSQ